MQYLSRALPLLAAAGLLAACATPAPPAAPPPTEQRRVQFTCADGEAVEMRFFPQQGVGVLVRGGRTMELQQQPAASGFVYSNGPNTVRDKGDELTIEIGRMAPISCRAR
jgi:membrane-bound inhibitor of C-type lysozyme